MEMKIFAVKDQKGDMFNQPFQQRTVGEAERMMSRLIEDPQSMVGKFPEDFDLYELGSYNTLNGVIKPHDSPRHVAPLTSYVRK